MSENESNQGQREPEEEDLRDNRPLADDFSFFIDSGDDTKRAASDSNLGLFPPSGRYEDIMNRFHIRQMV